MTEARPPERAPGAKRPVSILLTVACALAGLADLQAFAFAFSRENRERFAATPWVLPAGAAVALLQIACLVLLWRGRKAGLFGFLGLAVVYAAGLVPAVGTFALCSLLPSVLVAAAGAWNWERLR
ncbi:MAG TPA: hypothetical protein VFE93_18910 [Myxococcaceae bacterium]|nr:hypothetical protein [Myxococcaceae bacterium]